MTFELINPYALLALLLGPRIRSLFLHTHLPWPGLKGTILSGAVPTHLYATLRNLPQAAADSMIRLAVFSLLYLTGVADGKTIACAVSFLCLYNSFIHANCRWRSASAQARRTTRKASGGSSSILFFG